MDSLIQMLLKTNVEIWHAFDYTVCICMFCHPGTSHHDLHEGNIICLDHAAKQGISHAGIEALSQFGVIGFGDMTVSCRVFDLSFFLHLGTRCEEAPTRDYVDYLKKVIS